MRGVVTDASELRQELRELERGRVANGIKWRVEAEGARWKRRKELVERQ